jgi:hypothetical protein
MPQYIVTSKYARPWGGLCHNHCLGKNDGKPTTIYSLIPYVFRRLQLLPETLYLTLSIYWNVSYNNLVQWTANKQCENIANFKYFGCVNTSEWIHNKIKSRLNSENASYYSVLSSLETTVKLLLYCCSPFQYHNTDYLRLLRWNKA